MLSEVNTKVDAVKLDDIPCVRIVKQNKVEIADENTYALLTDCDFHNGTIEVNLLSRLTADAPSHARGFIGIVFRTNDENNEFESFYVRPTNGRNCTDPVRRSHGCQYFSYPGYTFSYFREYGITKYENAVDLDLNEWFTLRAEIKDSHGDFYINGVLVLSVDDLKHGSNARGGVGIYVDMGTEGFSRNLNVNCMD